MKTKRSAALLAERLEICDRVARNMNIIRGYAPSDVFISAIKAACGYSSRTSAWRIYYRWAAGENAQKIGGVRPGSGRPKKA